MKRDDDDNNDEQQKLKKILILTFIKLYKIISEVMASVKPLVSTLDLTSACVLAMSNIL